MNNENKVRAYTDLYHLAEEVLCSLIPKLSDEGIDRLTPKKANWFPVPLLSETEIKEVANRPQPHIDFKILDNQTIRIGIRCNTVASVQKMMNLLDELHTTEKNSFLAEMSKLDSDFQTQVLNKIKETNFSQVDRYECKFVAPSNTMNGKLINEMFGIVRDIREEGKKRMKEEQLSLNPETPVIDITFTTIQHDKELFKHKLAQIKKMYEICLSIKTESEIKTARRRIQEKQATAWESKIVCSKCGKEYQSTMLTGIRFCEDDGMRLITVKIKKN